MMLNLEKIKNSKRQKGFISNIGKTEVTLANKTVTSTGENG